MSIRHDYFFKSSRISRRFRVCGSSLWFPLTCSLKGTGRLGWSLGLVDGPGWSWGLVETSPNSWNSMITLAQGPMCVFSFHDKLLMCFWLKRIVRHGILSTHNTLGCILWGEVCLLWQCIHKSIYIYIFMYAYTVYHMYIHGIWKTPKFKLKVKTQLHLKKNRTTSWAFLGNIPGS